MRNTARDPILIAVFSRTTRVYGGFTDLLVLHGRIISVFHGEELSIKIIMMLTRVPQIHM